MKTFRTVSAVEAPPQRVWEVMSDVDRWHEWTRSITSVERLEGKPLAPGTKVRIRQPKLPPALWTVTDVQPGRSFTWQSRTPGLLVVARHVVEPADGGATVTLVIEIHGVLAGFWASLTGGITERYMTMEATGLKARSEGRTG